MTHPDSRATLARRSPCAGITWPLALNGAPETDGAESSRSASLRERSLSARVPRTACWRPKRWYSRSPPAMRPSLPWWGSMPFSKAFAAILGSRAELPVAHDLGRHGLDQLPVRDSRWARRLAGAALDAQVPVFEDRGARPYAPLAGGLHQGDPAARRLGLQPRLQVRGARLQAKAAVDALVEVLLVEDVGAKEGRRGRHQMPPT